MEIFLDYVQGLTLLGSLQGKRSVTTAMIGMMQPKGKQPPEAGRGKGRRSPRASRRNPPSHTQTAAKSVKLILDLCPPEL